MVSVLKQNVCVSAEERYLLVYAGMKSIITLRSDNVTR